MPQLVYSVSDRVLLEGTLYEVGGCSANRFGGPVYRLVPIDGSVAEPRWLTPRREGAPARVIDRAALRALVHTFYGSVRADPELGPVFESRLDERWPEHLERLVSFWASVLLAEGSFVGNPMMRHRAIGEMRPTHFARWLDLWDQAVTTSFEPSAGAVLRQRALAMARGISNGLFGRPFDSHA